MGEPNNEAYELWGSKIGAHVFGNPSAAHMTFTVHNSVSKQKGQHAHSWMIAVAIKAVVVSDHQVDNCRKHARSIFANAEQWT